MATSATLSPPLPGRQSPLTQPADGTVAGLVAQRVSAGVAQAQVAAGQDQRVPQVRQAHHTLIAVVTVLLVRGLQGHQGSEGRSEAGGQLRGREGPSGPGRPTGHLPRPQGKGKPKRAEEGHRGSGLLMRRGPESSFLGTTSSPRLPHGKEKLWPHPKHTPQIKEFRSLSSPQNQRQNVEKMPHRGTRLLKGTHLLG